MITDYVYNFSPDNPPVKKVKKGSSISLKTLDCFSNQVRSEDQLVTSIDFERVNPATGPLYVEGAKPGDILVVDILDIEVEEEGFVVTLPDSGPLFAAEGGLRTKKIPVRDGYVTFNDLQFAASPMVGVIGVAPQEGAVPCGFPGAHGGNMDCSKIVKGSRVYFPVNVPGALFQLGDLHASMGDGEICGAGVEIAGEVTVKLDVIEKLDLQWPVVETEDYWYAIASDGDFTKALEYSAKQIQDLLTKAYGWDGTDAYMYMSVAGSLEICQACQPSAFPIVVRFGVPKIEGKDALIPDKRA